MDGAADANRQQGNAGRARPRKLRKRVEAPVAPVDGFRASHLALVRRRIATEYGVTDVLVDEAESPLTWLASRRGRGGRPLVAPHQLAAGERLRADFTGAQMMPHVTMNWANQLPQPRRNTDPRQALADGTIAARQCVRQALDAVGPEFAGLLVDVCCFLKGLEEIERERRWPLRSAKVVRQLALERLARHYGYAAEARGKERPRLRTWVENSSAINAAD